MAGTGRGFLRRWIARIALRLGGWTVETPPPDLLRYVIIAAPHTYWWDGFWMKAFSWYHGLPLRWLVKLDSTRGPFGWLVRATGGIPVDRSSPQGLVGQLIDEFGKSESLVVVIPPEGTRSRREYWKSGFYHVADKAGVPVCLSYLDYGRMVVGCGPCFMLSGDMQRDMDRIRDFYKDRRGKRHEEFTPPRLREEQAMLELAAGTDNADERESHDNAA